MFLSIIIWLLKVTYSCVFIVDLDVLPNGRRAMGASHEHGDVQVVVVNDPFIALDYMVKWVLLLLLLSSLQTVWAMVCANHFFALGKFGEHSRGLSNSYASFVLSKLPRVLYISKYACWGMN